MRCLSFAALVVAALFPAPSDAATPQKAENVLIVTLDGFRWQELFSGADEAFMDAKSGGVKDVPGLKKRYWRDTATARREALMPFFWGTLAKKGQVFGNPARKAATRSTNGLKFSYPGYSEMFCGFPDPSIDSNGKKDNPNLSVLEFLDGRPGFKGKVEIACTWDVFPFIFRTRKNGLRILSGWEPIKADRLTEREKQLNELLEMVPRYWPDNCFDVFTMGATRSALERRKPRVLYIGLGETDEWGHGRRYDLYLDSANKADRFLAETWAGLQNDPHYKDKTALLITTDHGRGPTRTDWTDHGKKVPNAEFVWAAVMGPGVLALGERENVEVTQSQVAATVASLLGEDFNAASPKAAKPFPMTKTPTPSVDKKSAPKTLRVLSYNIHHGEGTDGKLDLARIAGVIKAANSDLVALQEVDRNAKLTGGVDQTKELARLTGLHAEFAKAIPLQGGEYGQAILSRFPLMGVKGHELPGKKGQETRIVIEARVEPAGLPALTFLGTHFQHDNAKTREEQAAKLNELFGKSAQPVILAGDLNAVPGSAPIKALQKEWTFATSPGGKGLFTIPTDAPKRQIDYVLYRPAGQFKVAEAKVIEEKVASDHRPVLVVLEWAGE